MARLFVAVRPPDEVLDAVEVAVGRARRELVGPRWASRDQWHVTVQFLGNAADPEAVAQALVDVSRQAGFPARLGAAGAFPTPARARVVWVGFDEGAAGCGRVAAAVADALTPLGYTAESRRFHPHLTVARLRVPAPVHPAVDALAAALGDASPMFVITDVVLYESQLGRSGARYTEVGRVPLAGNA